MTLGNICISDYDFSAEERYMARIILDYLGNHQGQVIKREIKDAISAREKLAKLLVSAFSYTSADNIRVEHPSDLSEEEKKYKEVVEAYQKKLYPDLFAKDCTEEFMRFLKDCYDFM